MNWQAACSPPAACFRPLSQNIGMEASELGQEDGYSQYDNRQCSLLNAVSETSNT
jgi:hypothetical protein